MSETDVGLSELPEGWAWTTLEDCTEILDSQRVPINAKERETRISGKSENELYPYYGATGQVGWIDDFLFDDELILLGEDGAPFLDFSKDKAYLIKGRSWVNNHAHVLRARTTITSNQLLCHYLNIFDYHEYVTGTTRLKLNQSLMRKIPVPLAPLPEQHRIVAKIEELFTKLDAGINALRKAQTQLKRYRQSVLKAAFEGKLTEAWRAEHQDEIEPASVLLERVLKERRKKWEAEQLEQMKAKGEVPKDDKWKAKYKEPTPLNTGELPELPKGWVWATVEQLLTKIQYGSSRKTTDDTSGVPVLRMGNIVEGKIVQDNLKYLPKEHDEFPELLLKKGDLLFNRTNSRELVGKTAVYTGISNPCSFASYLIRVRFSPRIDSLIVAHYINSVYGKNWILSVVSQQAGQANVNGTKLKLLAVPIPPEREQQVLVEEVERRFSVADEVEKTVVAELKRAEQLRQSILKKAFSGGLVPQDANDEPASVLLERIRAEKS